MLTKRLVVGLDIDQAQVVKCIKFMDQKVIGDPAELGQRYELEGADELVYLDISASLEGRDLQLDWIRRTAESVFIPFSVVGGVRNLDDFRQILLAGADKVGLNTGAVENPDLIRQAAEVFGSQCVMLTLDAKPTLDTDEGMAWEVYTHSGRRATGMEALEWALQAQELGAGEIVYTSIEHDGTRDGYDVEFTRKLADNLKIPVVASGGAGTAEHVVEVFTEAHADAALIASLVHYDLISIQSLKQVLAEANVLCRT
jgi:cyclase